jgi:Rps23 Pro-64 3,4-dihydroxylase Tpa1-like proline 4-hydroxylase
LTQGAAFALNPKLDWEELRERFARTGRIQIEQFLEPAGAERLAAFLRQSDQWRRVINAGNKVFESSAADYAAMPADQKAALDQAVMAEAAFGFQFRYDSMRVEDEEEARQSRRWPLDEFAQFMSSAEVLDRLSAMTGADGLDFADAQATRYMPGDFLTRHDDNVAGKHRRLAYVMGLTSGWRPEWSGLLMFVDEAERPVEVMSPRFNALCLFAIPQPHSVMPVAPYAQEPRISVTGWIRSRSN